MAQVESQKKLQMEVISILDMSGSMYNLRQDTIGGYNSYIETIKKEKTEDSEIYVTLILFNTNTQFVYKRIPINEVKQLDDNTYKPNGCTALNDAIGEGISYMDEVLSMQRSVDKVIKVAMYIQTDGLENSSKKYNKNQIKELITEKQNKEWDVVFAACNIDSFATGQAYGIQAANIAQINSDGRAQHAIYSGLGHRFNKAMRSNGNFDQSESLQQCYARFY